MIVFAGCAARKQKTKIKIGHDDPNMTYLKILMVTSVFSLFSLFSLFLSRKFGISRELPAGDQGEIVKIVKIVKNSENSEKVPIAIDKHTKYQYAIFTISLFSLFAEKPTKSPPPGNLGLF